MSCVDVNPHRVTTSASMNSGRYATESFAENNMGTAVQNSHNLSVAFDRHPSNRTFG